jgi:TonB family protein
MARRFLLVGLSAILFLPIVCSAQQQESQSSSIPPPPGHMTPPPPEVSRVKVAGNVQAAKLLHQVAPKYPDEARAKLVEGSVVLHAIIGKNGNVKDLTVDSGPALLIDAASDAVRQWVYMPTLLNGEPIEVDTTITVNFVLDVATDVNPNNSIDPQLKADILHLLQTMKGLEAAEAGIRSTFESLRPQLEAALPRTPNREKVIDAYEEKLVALVRQPEFQDGIVAIYAKHLSDDDIKAIDQFYQTPAGQHFVTQLPIIVNESSALGQQAATDGIPRILGELCQEFPELKGQTDFCPGEKDKQSRLMPPRTPPLSRPSPSSASEGN